MGKQVTPNQTKERDERHRTYTMADTRRLSLAPLDFSKGEKTMMTRKKKPIIAVFMAVTIAVMTSPLSGQYEIPDSLAYLGMPDDPHEFPAMVRDNRKRVSLLFEVGCPYDDGWAEAAYTELLRVSETDLVVRHQTMEAMGFIVKSYYLGRRGRGSCSSDAPRIENELIDQLRGEWKEGHLLRSENDTPLRWTFLLKLASSRNPDMHSLVREIALDGEVSGMYRDVAAYVMVDHHYGESTRGKELWQLDQERYLDAMQATLFEMAPSPWYCTSQHGVFEQMQRASFERIEAGSSRWPTAR